MPTTKKSMKAVFDCSADEPGELSFKEGDILVDVEESGEEGWYTGRIQHTSETGLFPYNYVVELLPAAQTKQESPPLSKFPPLDAFEAAMSPSAAKASLKSKSTAITATTISPSPPIIAAKPKLASTAPSSSNVGLGIRVYGSNNNNNNNKSSTFEKPQLKPIGSIKSMESTTSPTRSRSYSTSAVSEKEPIQTEKTLRPSQLLNGKGTKSALELALSKGSPKSHPSSSATVKSSAFPTSLGNSTGGIALPGMSTIKLNNTPHDAVEEDEDGFQMVKPSQLRSRQQVTPIRPIVSQSSSFASTTSTTTPSWKKTPDSKVVNTVKTASPSSLSSTSSSPRPMSGSKLDAAPSTSTPMPRLPSRPVSTASRRSRNSRNSSSSLKSSPSTSSKTTPTVSNANLPPVRETGEKPPVLKPKPQIAQPNLPPRPKLRSTSNPPPPIQPKPAMSSIEILLSKNNNNNKNESVVPSKSTTPPPRNAATKPAMPSTNKKPANLANRPSLDSWQSVDSANASSSSDVNIKPSALLKNNRARSATNPVSSSTTPEWMSALNKQPKPVPYERPTSPIAHPVSRSPAPMAAAVIEPATASTSTPTAKKNPPPPPPSRPPKSQQSSNSKQRYQVLFDSIHDDGYVDGETAHFVWLKSKLSNEDLARIWRECDPDHKGLLDKHAFIDGMSKIDELLSLKQQQQQQQQVV